MMSEGLFSLLAWVAIVVGWAVAVGVASLLGLGDAATGLVSLAGAVLGCAIYLGCAWLWEW